MTDGLRACAGNDRRSVVRDGFGVSWAAEPTWATSVAFSMRPTKISLRVGHYAGPRAASSLGFEGSGMPLALFWCWCSVSARRCRLQRRRPSAEAVGAEAAELRPSGPGGGVAAAALPAVGRNPGRVVPFNGVSFDHCGRCKRIETARARKSRSLHQQHSWEENLRAKLTGP